MKKKLALFDLDGTIMRTAWSKRIIKVLAEKSHKKAEALKIYKQSVELYKSWERREISHQVFSKIHTDALLELFKDLPVAEFERIVHDVVAEHKDKTYLFTRGLLKHLADTHHIFVITGTNKEVLNELQKHYPIDEHIGSVLEIVDGKFTGGVVSSPYYGKAELMREISERFAPMKGSIAIGDTALDIPMLEAAELPIAFNPSHKLLLHAQEKGWMIVTERKDVITIHDNGSSRYLNALEPIPFDELLSR